MEILNFNDNIVMRLEEFSSLNIQETKDSFIIFLNSKNGNRFFIEEFKHIEDAKKKLLELEKVLVNP